MSRLSETLSDNNAVLSIKPSYITPEEVVSHVSESVQGSITNVIQESSSTHFITKEQL